jgi:hypothetical protein
MHRIILGDAEAWDGSQRVRDIGRVSLTDRESTVA